MRIVAFNSSHHKGGDTATLVEKLLAGARSVGVETEHVRLADHRIGFCTNCLTCYQDPSADIGACSLKDDVRTLLAKVRQADGVVLASPLHSGFVNGTMTTFLERLTFTLCRPGATMMGLRGCPVPRLTEKARACAAVINAGMIPPGLRQYCDLATPWLKDGAPMMFNGEWVGELYAAAMQAESLSDEECHRGFLLKRLTDEQLRQAFDLGVALAKAALAGPKPYAPPS
ncbi:MAG: flavodoxin family protein [Candidatus Riflebacteria bacterium]|nr:flavodoxin family protein [Candidatus Riflebacteria bacterium]